MRSEKLESAMGLNIAEPSTEAPLKARREQCWAEQPRRARLRPEVDVSAGELRRPHVHLCASVQKYTPSSLAHDHWFLRLASGIVCHEINSTFWVALVVSDSLSAWLMCAKHAHPCGQDACVVVCKMADTCYIMQRNCGSAT
eukprot:6404457-Amphidinium_carterae.1